MPTGFLLISNYVDRAQKLWLSGISLPESIDIIVRTLLSDIAGLANDLGDEPSRKVAAEIRVILCQPRQDPEANSLDPLEHGV